MALYLASERLSYRKFDLSEFEDYARWYTNEDVMKNITGRGLTMEEAQERFLKAMTVNKEHPEMGFFAARNKTTNEFIGIAKLARYKQEQIEIGYGFLPAYWGKGYATEMIMFFIEHARKVLQVRELIAIVNSNNMGSKKVLLRQGFELYDQALEDNQPTEYYKLQC